MSQNSIRLADIKTYLIEKGVSVKANAAEEFINSCFEKCDTKDETGKNCNDGDNLLSGEEKEAFFVKLAVKFKEIAQSLSELFKEKTTLNGSPVTKRWYIVDDHSIIIKTRNNNFGHDVKEYDTDGNLVSTIENEIFTTYYTEGSNKGKIKSHNGVKFEYYENGSIKRKDDHGVKMSYDFDGKIKSKTYTDYEKHQYIEERYREDGSLAVLTKYNLEEDAQHMEQQYMSQRTIYNENGTVFLDTKYNREGHITDYTKNLPKGKFDFDENLLNGELDAYFSQGLSGICYIASAVKSLLQTENGTKILNKSLDYNKKKSVGKVMFAGIDKEYTFTKNEIMQAMTRLGTGDPDFTLLCLGYEKYREENNRVIDGGTAGEFLSIIYSGDINSNYELRTGKKTKSIDDEMMQKFKETMQTKQCFSSFGTLENLPDSALKKGLHPLHEYFAKSFNNENFVVSDAAYNQDIEVTPEEFKKYFGDLAFKVFNGTK